MPHHISGFYHSYIILPSADRCTVGVEVTDHSLASVAEAEGLETLGTGMEVAMDIEAGEGGASQMAENSENSQRDPSATTIHNRSQRKARTQ